jgi:hypothetical protein
MAIDDHPLDALQHQLVMEGLASDPVARKVIKIFSVIKFGPPFDQIIGKINEKLGAESLAHIKIVLETCVDEVKRLDREFRAFKDATAADPERAAERTEIIKDLVVDAARKSENTRSKERVKRIGLILANAVVASRPDADEFEELMRVAMELADGDVALLRELVRIEGAMLSKQEYIPRYTAHQQWEFGKWGSNIDPELDSVFSKLESFGLVSRIPPPSNLNITADIQNRYVLLKKGLRFATFVRQSS